MDYPEINERAEKLGRFLTTFQLLAGHEVPAVILDVHVEIIARTATELHQMLQDNPDARVEVRTGLGPMAGAWQESLMGPTEVPDTIPDDLLED